MFTFLKDLLFPRVCLSCSKFGCYICSGCAASLVISDEKTELTNGNGPVDEVITIFQYTPVLKKLIANIKYRLVTDAFGELFSLLSSDESQIKLQRLKELIKNDRFLVQPVPLHSRKQKIRGFNQAEIIAKWLAQQLHLPLIDILKKIKETETQAQLNRQERMQNARNSFGLKEGVVLGKNSVILVDDVVTTGSTVKDAANVLKKNGAEKVIVFSIARG